MGKGHSKVGKERSKNWAGISGNRGKGVGNGADGREKRPEKRGNGHEKCERVHCKKGQRNGAERK